MYTEALAYAISKLDGEARDKARQALAERLTRMSSATLKDKLQDEDAEIRRAAALAVGMKEDKTNLPRLIEMLKDPEATVGRAAHAALKSLSSQDFGPTADASKADVDKAIAAWQDWWNKQSK
jgi:HEAT repeat protein